MKISINGQKEYGYAVFINAERATTNRFETQKAAEEWVSIYKRALLEGCEPSIACKEADMRTA